MEKHWYQVPAYVPSLPIKGFANPISVNLRVKGIFLKHLNYFLFRVSSLEFYSLANKLGANWRFSLLQRLHSDS